MKKVLVFLFLSFFIIAGADAASFLTAEKFPTTIEDVPFAERVELMRADYAAWESEYDEHGRCISGCAYSGITVEEDMEMMRRATVAATAASEEYLLKNPIVPTTQPKTTVPAPSQSKPQTTPEPAVILPVVSEDTVTTAQCTPRHDKIPPTQNIPLGKPFVGEYRMSSPFGLRTHPVTGRARQPHKGIDYAVPTGTNLYATANGVVHRVWTDATCGRAIQIDHSDGYTTLYCHLNKQLVKQGDQVHAGCLVAQSGNTGRSTGPHLHYGIYYNRTLIDPAEFVNKIK